MKDHKEPTPYEDLNFVLSSLVDGIRSVLHEHLVGVYLQGSFAVGDFDQHSDVDFIVVTEGELFADQVAALQQLHGRIYELECAWAQHLEGSYFPKEILRDCALAGTPLWYLDNGSRELIQHPHCNTVVVRSVVRESGVPLVGPDPATLVDPIPMEVLRRDMLAKMTNWESKVLADPSIISNRFGQTYAVLNYCRMLHDLGNGTPGSKRSGAEWTKRHLDPKWADLIDRAWLGRPTPEVSSRQPADPVDVERTLAFIREIMRMSLELSKPAGEGS